jgi:quinone-modifying oxidoreductase subunit QmoB
VFSYGAQVIDLVALKQALYVRELDPRAQAYVIYEGIVTPGLYESFYRHVQQQPGIVFSKGEIAAVSRGEGRLRVAVTGTLLGGPLSLAADLVVLGTGMAPALADQPLHLAYRQGPDVPEGRFGFASSNFLCFPYETQRTGVYAAGAAREPMDAAFSAEDATGAALKAIQSLELVRSGKAVHPRSGDLSLPHTRTAGCTRCGRCSQECPFSAIELDEKSYPVLNPTRCRRCGICMGACPVRVISFQDYSVEQLTAMVRAIEFPEDETVPRIVVMCCENDAYPAFDQLGIHRLQYSAAVRVIPLRCLGSLNVAVVADALSGGVDGVMLMGCRTGEDYQCHFIRGSELAAKRMSNLQETLGRLMLEPERVSVEEVEISDYLRLPAMIDSFVSQIETMGPNPYKGF